MTEPADPQLALLVSLVVRLDQILRGSDDPAERAAAAASVDELRAVVAKPAPGATGRFDLGQLADALAALASWLRAPTPDGEARAERAMSELQTVLGPLVGWDPAREDAARRAQYRREARAALDGIFPDKPKR